MYRQSIDSASLSHYCNTIIPLPWQSLKGQLFSAGVSYLLAPKSCMSFGEKSNCFVIDFEEESKGGAGVMEVLMQNLAASGSKEVRKQVKDRLT